MASNGQRIDATLLRRARLRKGWTLRRVMERTEEIARSTGQGKVVDHGNIARYERGDLLPTPGTLLMLATALDLTVDELLLDEDPDDAPAPKAKVA